MKIFSKIDGRYIRSTIASDQNVQAPILCFSAMVPCVSEDGLKRVRAEGGYVEFQLPDLGVGSSLDLIFSYEDPEHTPTNRAWLPLAAHLRCGTDLIPLEITHPVGVDRSQFDYPDGDIPDLRLCPQPSSLNLNGGTISVSGFTSDTPELSRVNDLFQRVGLTEPICEQGQPIAFKIDTGLRPDAYVLDIQPETITLTHSDRGGAFYGALTLATLLHTHDGTLPCGTIQDTPRFEWRGQHLDCARHFYKVETILRLLDLMALLKLNRFHWHFADDEAFRLELSRLPELSETHTRGEGELVPGVFGGGIISGGSYSRADAERVIAHAKSLNIEVLPEIEVPAHAYALCRLYPNTRDRQENGQERSVQWYHGNVMNPAMLESWRIWETMVDEVAEIFPFHTLHLGGDELPHDTWQGSPKAKDLMRQEGLETTQDLQGWTMNKLAQYVAAKGKTPAGWEESALGNPSIQNDAVIFSWTGQGPGLQAARDGHKVVMMPGQKTYLDMAQTPSVGDWGASWAAIIGLQDTIDWQPVPSDEPELEDNIIGVEGAFWSEFTTKDSQMEPMLAPRILGIAAMAWQSKDSTDPDQLFGMRSVYAPIFDAIGWQQT